MIKKYIKHNLEGGSGFTSQPEYYGSLGRFDKLATGTKFRGNVFEDIEFQVVSMSGSHMEFFSFDDLGEFGQGLDGAGLGESYVFEIVEMEESEFEELCEKHEFGGY